jgi:20S proteasome subunit beta 6
LNKERQSVVDVYDAIGSFFNLKYGIQGSGVEMGVLLLDNQLIGHNRLVKSPLKKANSRGSRNQKL